MTTIPEALHSLHTEPFPCVHCRRTIPADMVVTLFCESCPLDPPCIRRGALIGSAWPGQPDDDDDDSADPRPPEPVLPALEV